MILVIAEDFWGDIGEDDLPTWETRTFQCGHCSSKIAGVTVRHNIFGRHMHKSKDELEAMIKEAGLLA